MKEYVYNMFFQALNTSLALFWAKPSLGITMGSVWRGQQIFVNAVFCQL